MKELIVNIEISENINCINEVLQHVHSLVKKDNPNRNIHVILKCNGEQYNFKSRNQ